MKKQLRDIANWVGTPNTEIEDCIVTGVSIDSRTVRPGDLFIPFRGDQVNGHRYVQQAIEGGAVATLWLKDEPNPPTNIPVLFVQDSELALQEMARAYRQQLHCTIIGITGSNGKTSTKDLIASVLSPSMRVQKTVGNFNNELGLPITLLSLEEDTEVAVLEMGMSGFGEIEFLSNLAEPHIAIITNIGEAHMQDLGSREGIAKAKFEITAGLANDGLLLYDADEPLLTPFIEQAPVRTASFGYTEQADLRVDSIEAVDQGSHFTVHGLMEGQFTIPVYGAHQVKNAAAAITIGLELGLTREQLEKAIQQVELTAMRMQPIVLQNGALCINDAYNAAPTSMKAALYFVRETTLRTKKWVVLGDMLELGADERTYHEAIAEQLQDGHLQGILLYGSRMKWLYDKLDGTLPHTTLVWSEDCYDVLVEQLLPVLDQYSLVLLKGSRGMELEHIIRKIQEQQ